MSKLIVNLEGIDDIAAALEVVSGLIEEGFTSGFYPAWGIEND